MAEKELEINIEDLFKDETEQLIKPNEEKSDDNTMTKAVSERINTVREQTKNETQEKIAKDLGYESYADLQKAKEQKLIKEAGLDENDENQIKVLDKLVEERLANDPRFKKLEEFEQNEKAKFVKSQLDEISAYGEKYTSVDQLPKDVLDLWGKTGNLKQAFLAVKGDELLAKKSNRDTSFKHLGDTGSGYTGGTQTRVLTEQEKKIYRMVNPDISEDELAKKTVEI